VSFQLSTIPAGQVTLRGFEENGLHKHAQGIETFQQLANSNNLLANQEIIWEIPINFQLMSIWMKLVEVPSELAKSTILINSLGSNNNFVEAIAFNLKAKQLDNQSLWVGWEPPLTIFSKGSVLKAKTTVAVESIFLVGKECYFNSVIRGSIIQ